MFSEAGSSPSTPIFLPLRERKSRLSAAFFVSALNPPLEKVSDTFLVGWVRLGGFAFVDLAVFADVFEADRDLLADARLLHRDAVQGGRRRHRLLAVRDHDEF